MKNLPSILNGILLLAVAVLYFIHFSGKDTSKQSDPGEAVDIKGVGPAHIAYINIDTLFKNYAYYDELSDKFESRKAALEKELQNRVSGFQSEVANFQRDANNMTIAKARAQQEELAQKEQNLVKYQQDLTQQLSQEEVKFQNDLYDRVAGFLSDYGRENNYQLVLSYSKGGGVFYASDSLDITGQVLAGLNSQYNQEQVTDSAKVEQ